MTLREFELRAAELDAREPGASRVLWDAQNPGAFLCATDALRSLHAPLHRVCDHREVMIAGGVYVHRWASLRGQTRHDLLDRISLEARTILEFGCGEAPLGEALKRRQKCRVVGAYYEPWSFLADLRRISAPGGSLLLSLPNVANASVVNDLLQGRFDYVYMGLTCVGHLRFFTRRSVEEMLAIAGWEVVSVEPQFLARTQEQDRLLEAMQKTGVPFEESEVAPSGFYVTARNRA